MLDQHYLPGKGVLNLLAQRRVVPVHNGCGLIFPKGAMLGFCFLFSVFVYVFVFSLQTLVTFGRLSRPPRLLPCGCEKLINESYFSAEGKNFDQNFGHHTGTQISAKIPATTRRPRYRPEFRPPHGDPPSFHFVVLLSFRFRFD